MEEELEKFVIAAIEAGATVYKSKDGEGGIYVKGKKLTTEELLSGLLNPKPPTNADCIRSMTDEELAEFLDEYVTSHWPCKDDTPIDPETKECKISSCAVCWLDWLKSEVE